MKAAARKRNVLYIPHLLRCDAQRNRKLEGGRWKVEGSKIKKIENLQTTEKLRG